MKKIFTAVAAVLFASSAMAIDYLPEPGVTWQGVFGMNVSSIRGDAYNGRDDAYNGSGFCDFGSKVGVNFGIRAEYMLPDCYGTYVSGGLLWSQKGGKHNETRSYTYEGESGTTHGKHKVIGHYIEIPIHVGYRYNINDDWGVFAEFGPYFAVGVCGKNRFDIDGDGTKNRAAEFEHNTFKKRDNALDETIGGLQRFDAGLGFRVGAEYANRYSVNLGFDWGLTDMLRDDYRDYFFDKRNYSADKLRNFNMSITLGYRF